MVSVESSNHYSLETKHDSTKKPRLVSYCENSCIIDLQPSYRSENLKNLTMLFPILPHSHLESFLDRANNNFDHAIQLIQSHEKAKFAEFEFSHKAQIVVQGLGSVQSFEQAVEIVKELLVVREKNENCDQTIRVMKEQIKAGIQENSLLKRLVSRLSENVKEVMEKDKVIGELKRKVDKEKEKSQYMQMQIYQARNGARM